MLYFYSIKCSTLEKVTTIKKSKKNYSFPSQCTVHTYITYFKNGNNILVWVGSFLKLYFCFGLQAVINCKTCTNLNC